MAYLSMSLSASAKWAPLSYWLLPIPTIRRRSFLNELASARLLQASPYARLTFIRFTLCVLALSASPLIREAAGKSRWLMSNELQSGRPLGLGAAR